MSFVHFHRKVEIERRNNFEKLRAVFYSDIHYMSNSLGKNAIKIAISSQGCELYFLNKSSNHQYSFTAPKVQKNKQPAFYSHVKKIYNQQKTGL